MDGAEHCVVGDSNPVLAVNISPVYTFPLQLSPTEATDQFSNNNSNFSHLNLFSMMQHLKIGGSVGDISSAYF